MRLSAFVCRVTRAVSLISGQQFTPSEYVNPTGSEIPDIRDHMFCERRHGRHPVTDRCP